MHKLCLVLLLRCSCKQPPQVYFCFANSHNKSWHRTTITHQNHIIPIPNSINPTKSLPSGKPFFFFFTFLVCPDQSKPTIISSVKPTISSTFLSYPVAFMFSNIIQANPLEHQSQEDARAHTTNRHNNLISIKQITQSHESEQKQRRRRAYQRGRHGNIRNSHIRLRGEIKQEGVAMWSTITEHVDYTTNYGNALVKHWFLLLLLLV